jgi:hypothetical protein
VAVRGALATVGADVAVRAGAVVDDDRLLQRIGQRLADRGAR